MPGARGRGAGAGMQGYEPKERTMAELNRESRAERAAPRMNGSLIVGLLVGFVLGAIAGGLMVEELIENRNEPTKPFVGVPEPAPEAPAVRDPDPEAE